MPQAIEKDLLVIDYPQEDERITSPSYAIRIGTFTDAEKVEVSIDDSDWKPCRSAVGYWWYDWSGYLSGSHEVTARVQLKDGHSFTAEPQPFRVELKTDAKASQYRGQENQNKRR